MKMCESIPSYKPATPFQEMKGGRTFPSWEKKEGWTFRVVAFVFSSNG